MKSKLLYYFSLMIALTLVMESASYNGIIDYKVYGAVSNGEDLAIPDSNQSLNNFTCLTGEKVISNGTHSYELSTINNQNKIKIKCDCKQGVGLKDYIIIGSDNSICGKVSDDNSYITIDLKEGENEVRLVNKNDNSDSYKFDITYKNVSINGLNETIETGKVYSIEGYCGKEKCKNIKWINEESSGIVINENGDLTAVKNGVAKAVGYIYSDDNQDIIGNLFLEFYVSGENKNGWINNNETWYYVEYGSGNFKTGWMSENGCWYYFEQSGRLKYGWLSQDGNWYYLKQTGNMAVGWFKDDGSWYYAESDGKMKTGWFKDHGNWYYLNSNGKMQTSEETIDGTSYRFNKNGELQLG